MRVMVLIKATANSEAGVFPDETLLTKMGAYNEALLEAGILLAGEGLRPSSHGKRLRFSQGEKTVIDGPFDLDSGIVAGFWIWQVASMEEAVEWIKRCPDPMPGEVAEIELRPIFEMEDFGEAMTDELREQETRLREATK